MSTFDYFWRFRLVWINPKISTMFLVTPRTALNLRKGGGDVCWTNRPKKELKRKLGTAMELLLFHASLAQIVSRMWTFRCNHGRADTCWVILGYSHCQILLKPRRVTGPNRKRATIFLRHGAGMSSDSNPPSQEFIEPWQFICINCFKWYVKKCRCGRVWTL